MRLLVVGGTPAHRGGVEQFCERAMAALAEAGHQAQHLPSHGAYLRPRSLPRFLRGAWRLLRERRADWDAVWLQYTSLPDLALLAVARIAGHRVLVTPHLGGGWASQSQPALRWLGTRLLALAHGIGLLAASQADELTLPTAVPRFALRTFLPRQFPHPAPRAPGGPVQLIHAGRLSGGKGSFTVVEMCATLARAGVPFMARLVGPCTPDTGRALQAAIMEAGLADRVRLLGAMPEAALMAELATADILVHPSLIDSYPLIVLESIGCGAFPLCIDLPGARLITATYCGHVVPAAAQSAARSAADFIGAHPLATLQRQAEAARQHLVEDFRWAACTALLESAVAGVRR